MGFEWGGRWKSFPDRPHLQWSDGGKYTSSMIRAGTTRPPCPHIERRTPT
ncbi:M15 family metallopeptidase [Flavonifractor plautii]|nr:M15 family metallopeptidase [Flavonifractor plautii]